MNTTTQQKIAELEKVYSMMMEALIYRLDGKEVPFMNYSSTPINVLQRWIWEKASQLQLLKEISPKIEQEVRKQVCDDIDKMIKRKLVIMGVKVLNENTEEDFAELLKKGADSIPSDITPEEVEKRFQIRKEVLLELKDKISKGEK